MARIWGQLNFDTLREMNPFLLMTGNHHVAINKGYAASFLEHLITETQWSYIEMIFH